MKNVFCPQGGGWSKMVAQIFNLLFRRIPFCEAWLARTSFAIAEPRRLEHRRNSRLGNLRYLALWFWLAMPGAAFAHDPGLSTVAVALGGEEWRVTATFARRDAEVLLNGAWELEHARRLAPEVIALERDGRPLRCRGSEARLDGADNVEFRLAFDAERGSVRVKSPLLAQLPRGHRQLLSVSDAAGRVILERMLHAGADAVEVEREAVPVAVPSFAGFVLLGVEHILTGYDHLLFLFALLMVTKDFRSAVKIITCFTVAHSITLALATLGLARFPASVVEPVIAASIVYVGVENLLTARRKAEVGKRKAENSPALSPRSFPLSAFRFPLFPFAFGLVHGFGFASVLRDLGVGAGGSGIVAPLLAFNLGVELGQVGVAMLVLPLIWKLQTRPVFVQRWVPACSVAVVLAGGWWLVERIYDL